MNKIFIDTNILVYSVDKSDAVKRTSARNQLKSIKNNGVISTQVLQEFYVAATKKLGVEPLLAKEIMHAFTNFEIVSISSDLIMQAIDCSILNKISFWDSLIVTAAESAHCNLIWSEDLNHNQIIRGVKVQNPFK